MSCAEFQITDLGIFECFAVAQVSKKRILWLGNLKRLNAQFGIWMGSENVNLL